MEESSLDGLGFLEQQQEEILKNAL